MALSRFFSIIVVCSIAWIFLLLFSGKFYSLTGVVNGKQGDPIVVAAKDSQEVKNEMLRSSQV